MVTMSNLILASKGQRWDPAEVVRILLTEEAAGRDGPRAVDPGPSGRRYARSPTGPRAT
nr:hypothetical protein GCM10025732_30400 [Glycomyces mayteni]